MGGDPYASAKAGEREGTGVSDPYGDRALLTSAMTKGYDAVPDQERERLRRYLEAVVAARSAPVHTAIAFNAVYFGYDLGGDGYGGSPLCLDDLPVITFGECAPVLPVGAMVCVATGSEPLYAEIVHRERAHSEVDALGDVPAWVSGAPAGAEGPGRPGDGAAPRRRDLLVPDLHAFGPDLINEDGHVVVDVCYPSREAARRDDLRAYAHHLLTTAREQLLSPFVPVSLAALVGGTHDDDLRAGLLGLLDTVQGALNSSAVVRTWGHYALTRASLADCWQDTGPLGVTTSDLSRQLWNARPPRRGGATDSPLRPLCTQRSDRGFAGSRVRRNCSGGWGTPPRCAGRTLRLPTSSKGKATRACSRTDPESLSTTPLRAEACGGAIIPVRQRRPETPLPRPDAAGRPHCLRSRSWKRSWTRSILPSPTAPPSASVNSYGTTGRKPSGGRP